MFKTTFLFATLLFSEVNVLGAPVAPTATDGGRGMTKTVSINCAGPNGKNVCSPSESAAVSSALASIIPAVEGKPGWTINRADDGRIMSLTIEGNEPLGAAAPGQEGGGEVSTQGLLDWFGLWRYDYNFGIGPKK